MKYTDPTGMWVDTFIDVVGAGLTVYEFYKDPTWGNAAWMVVDLGAVFVPFVPGSQTGRLAVRALGVDDFASLFSKGTKFNKNNYRTNLMTISGVSEATRKAKKLEAHHIIPQKYRDQLKDIINVDNPAFLTWVEQSKHRGFHGQYNKDWRAFFNANPNPTRDDILRKAKEMVDTYGDDFYEGKYYFDLTQEATGYQRMPN